MATGPDMSWYAFGITLFAGLTMVSNVRFWSGKDINLRRSVPFIVDFRFRARIRRDLRQSARRAVRPVRGYALSGYVMLLVKGWFRKPKPPAD
jgi:CDP-diacylglycerol--serine O-phosphatidyltransferase